MQDDQPDGVSSPVRAQARMDGWGRRVAVGIALLSGATALALLMLPLFLVLLMVLFDRMAHGVLVLLGLLLTWLLELLPSNGNGLPSYQAVTLQPLAVAVHALFHIVPCVAGLALILLNRRSGRNWWLVVPLWGVTAASSGVAVAVVLLPGLASILFVAYSSRQFTTSG